MKVFGDALNPSIPYKTFLLSIKDTAEWVVKEMLEKYGLKHEDPQNYCLLQVGEESSALSAADFQVYLFSSFRRL